ncbi:lipase family protein [Oceanispirochaeta sp.]|uniref:lipase family protein n=1 Tax=Oceanispirochaeta sp. TaxID=2035350 RepID=UPI0026195490|nr:lipase family protein [Oceanispirochaeta sp.]MDA3957613.1 lipase family protein [Oceanispirochaeta sp.]
MEPENLEYSPVNAWWLAESAFLVYCHPGFARMAYRLAGFEGFRFFQGKGTEVMIAWSSRAAIVSFRGTELKSRSALHEILTNLNALPVAFEGGGMVHKGFLQGLEEVWGGDEGLHLFLESMLDDHPERPLWICGHSLGGALASLCFARLPRAKGLYLYGSPRVGDQDFVELFKNRCVWRHEHARDPVPLVPLDLPALNFNYKDTGCLKYINGSGDLLTERPQFKVEDYISQIAQPKELQESPRNEIKQSQMNVPISEGGPRDLLNKISDHLQQTHKEVRGYLEELDADFGVNADDHHPIYYAVQLWNALISKRS